MRFIIHGAGAVGSLVGGNLAESGEAVVLIGRPDHVAAINDRGLVIKSARGDRLIKNIVAVEHPSQVTPQDGDIIFLTIKSAQTAEAVHDLRERFSEETPVFCLQNGVRNEELAARRFLRIYGAMAALSATFLTPGTIAHTMNNTISLGNYPLNCDELCREVAAKLNRAGFKTTTPESIMAVKWSKLILNLNNATYAIIDNFLQMGLVTPAISRFMADVEEEGLHVLDVSGIGVSDPDNPINFEKRLAELRSVVEDPEKIEKAAELPYELRTYPSTWMDLKLKRGETESSYFNGEIILLGEKHHINTPYNSTLLQIVESMAAEKAEPGRYTLDELIHQIEQRRMKLYNGEGLS